MTATPPTAVTPIGLSQAARAWLEARGLDSALCEAQGLVSRPRREADGKAEALIIPFEKAGRVVNRKYRSIDEKRWAQDKGGEQIFWRRDVLADAALADQPLVITEGEFDALAAIQAGYWRTVSIPAGAPEKPSDGRAGAKYAFIDEARTDLEPVKEIIIAADGDGPGAALLSDLTALLGPARCRFVTYPAGCKDLNDVLREYGAERVREVLEASRWVRVAGVHRLDELPPLPALEIWRPSVLGAIDKLIPICPGHISVWTGIAGHGKSTLLNAVLWTLADKLEQDGSSFRIAHGTFESTPQREYLEDATAFRYKRSIAELKPDQIKEARAWVNDHVVFLNSDGYANPRDEEWIDATLDWFLQAAQTAVVRHGCRIIVLDPWSQIDHEIQSGEREDQYIRRALKRLKMFARTFDVHVAIVAHPAKPRRNGDGTYDMPEGYEISGAAHWYNFADLGVTVHRHPPEVPERDKHGQETGKWEPDPSSTRVLIRVWKVKFHRAMNKPGDAYAQVNCLTGRYESAHTWEARANRRQSEL